MRIYLIVLNAWLEGRSYDKNQLQEIVEIKLPKLVDNQKNAFNVIAENLMNHQGRIFFF